MHLKFWCFVCLVIFSIKYFSSSSKLPQSACKVVNEVIKKEPWMKTIAVVEMRNNFSNGETNNFLQCLPINISTTLMKVDKNFNPNQQRVHNPTLVVLFMDSQLSKDEMQMILNLIIDVYHLPLLSHNNKFLIVTSSTKGIMDLKSLLNAISIVNFVIISEESGIVNLDLNSNVRHPFDSIGEYFMDEVYRMSLKNKTHKIFIYNQSPKLKINGTQMRGKLFQFMEAIEKVENSQMVYLKLRNNLNKSIDATIINLINTRGFEMTLNNLVVSTNPTPKLFTYEQTGYCPLVPIITKNAFQDMTFFKPFDNAIWGLMLLTTISCTILYHLAHRNASMWYIPFFLWAFHHGQSVNFATNRKIFVILLQILVFGTFILGNSFQGLITSYMIGKNENPRLSSTDELLVSDFKLLVGDHFDLLMAENFNYQKAIADKRVFKASDLPFLNFSKLHSENYAMITTCDNSRYYLDNGLDSLFYIIEEHLFAWYDQLQTIYLSKFIKRWQLLMDWSFEAGLPHAWELFEKDEKVFKAVEEKLEILRLDDISIVFYMLAFGYVLGFLALLGEIFHHDFIQPYFKRQKFLKYVSKWRENAKKKFKVRKHKVQPVNPS